MDDKAERSKAVSSQERDLLLHKTIEERKGKKIVPILCILIKLSSHRLSIIYDRYFQKEVLYGNCRRSDKFVITVVPTARIWIFGHFYPIFLDISGILDIISIWW